MSFLDHRVGWGAFASLLHLNEWTIHLETLYIDPFLGTTQGQLLTSWKSDSR